MQSLLKRKFFLILKRFFGLFQFKKNRAGFVVVGVLTIGVAIFLFPSVVNAQLGNMETISGGLMQGLTNLALGLGEFFIKMSIFFLRFFIALAHYNGYIDSPVVKLGWLMVRDVVNMFFVVILLVIAIGTILGIEQYQWNKTLVKLILSAVFVNFSNLICQLFIDAAHIFTLTFASAISATAGGNLINMFHFEKIYAITTGKNDIGIGGEGFNMLGRVLVSSIIAMLFALLAMLVMGAYAIMMLLRMTVLWVLIILSPMAFLFIALPQTANRYGEWWKEFSNYVVLGPTIAFFMWLAFATAGTGTLGSDIGITDDMLQAGSIDSVGALTLSAVTTWENMANFLVAIVLLFVGLQEVQKLNVAGGSVASKAKDFFGKVATIATGYAAGRWLVGKGKEFGEKGGKGALWYMPFMGGRRWSLRWQNEKASVQNWWYGKAAGLSKKGMEARMDLGEKKAEMESKQMAAERAATPEEKSRLQAEANVLQEAVKALEETVRKETGSGGVVGYFARRDIGTEKQLKKSEGQLEIRKKLAFKRVAGDSGGLLFNRPETQIKDQYRYERGALEVEEMRSSAKDKALGEKGKVGTMAVKRYRGGEFLDKPDKKTGREYYETMATEIAEHGRTKGKAENIIKAAQAKAEFAINVNATNKVQDVHNRERILDKELAEFTTPKEQELRAKLAVAKDDRDAEMQKIDAELVPQMKEAQKILQDENALETQKLAAKREFDGLEKDRKTRADAAQQKMKSAEDELDTYLKGDEAKNARKSEAYLKKEAEVNKEKADLNSWLAEKVPGAGAFMAAQQAAFAEGMTEATKSEMQAGILQLTGQQQLLSAINLSEQAKQGAEAFVKTIKEAELQRQFTDAAEKMNKLLKLSAKNYREELEKARRGEYGGFVTAMAHAQVAKEQEEDKDLARRTAEDAAYDAFVAKPRYGTISPSTAFSEYAKKRMDDFRKLERVAAYKKATDVLVHLQDIKDRGGELDVGQKAQLAAAVSFLTEEAWVDDKGEYMYGMLNKLKNGEITDAGEKTKWQGMAKMLKRVGWIKDGTDKNGNKIEDAIRNDGSIAESAVIKNTYDREDAADLQNLAMTGMDVDLIVAHKAIGARVDENTRQLKVKTAEETEKEMAAAMVDKKYQKERDEAGTLATSQAEDDFKAKREAAKKAASVAAKKEAKAKKLTGQDERDFVDKQLAAVDADFSDEKMAENVREAVDKEVRAAVVKAAGNAIRTRVEATIKKLKEEQKLETDYWKVAAEVLPTLGIDNIRSKGELKERYDRHSDLLQYAARTFKKNALDTGHEELGMNQDYDDREDVYRFQTIEEGRAKIRADRVKIDRAKLLNGDQYHSNGTLDYNTLILDDFLEEAIGITLGKVTKAIELTRVPERSLKGYFYTHKNADPQVRKQRGDDGKVRNYAVIGGDEAAQTKFRNDGDDDAAKQRDHMLTRGMLTHLLSGWRGMALGAHKLFNHVSEKDAQQGVINLQVGDQTFNTVQEMAKYIHDQLSAAGDNQFKQYLKKSHYRGQESRIMRQMKQIMEEKPQADFSSSAEDNEAANAG